MDKQTRQYLEELNHCIDFNDAVKGCALMPFFTDVSEEIRHTTLKKLFMSLESPGLPILTFLCNHLKKNNNAMAIEWVINRLLTPRVFGADDENRLAFWAASMADMRLPQALPRLLNLVISSRSPQVIASASRAILQLDTDDGARLIMRLCEEDPTRGIYIAETLPLAGKVGFEAVAELLSSTHHRLRNLAIDIFAAAGAHGVDALATHLKTAHTDSAIHAINALGRCGASNAIVPLLTLLSRTPGEENIRYAIFEAAGRLPSPKWALHLARGLADPSEQVRMAAAKAVDRNLSGALITGISNIIGFRDSTAKAVVGSLIDARTENTLALVLKAKGFTAIAEHHLIHKAHPAVRASCLSFLAKKGASTLVERVHLATRAQNAIRPKVLCVDDSKMMLLLYMKNLNALGYDTCTYDEPEKALDAIGRLSPVMMITDLNMPGMDGFSLASKVREARPDLPILMVTTQSDAAPPAGDGISPVDAILHKPFTSEGLKSAMDKLLTMDQAIDF